VIINKPSLEIIRYAPELLDEFHSLKVEDLKDLFTKNITLWINIEGNDPELLASAASALAGEYE
jgi:hypothetical protein